MIKKCPICKSNAVKKFGKTAAQKQRYFCKKCLKSFTWIIRKNKAKQEEVWFKWWIKEGLSLRQIIRISGHGKKKLKRIKNEWLKQPMPELYRDYAKAKYLIFDGTYFKRTNSLLLFMNDAGGKIISCRYVGSENYENAYKMASELKRFGVEPKSITLDGLKPIIAAVKDVWPSVIIQRCLYHIEHQGKMWLRAKPKTEAGKELKGIYNGLTAIKDGFGKEIFAQKYRLFLKRHGRYVKSLSYKEVGYNDLKKATSLIANAYDNMWHYLQDGMIPKTTNKLEGYFSELKHQYGKHKGLSKRNRDSYLKWYCYYKNHSK